MPAAATWPGWQHDHRTADYWATRLSEDLGGVLTAAAAEQLARDYAAINPGPRDGRTDAELTALALAWLLSQNINLIPAIAGAVIAMRTDGAYLGAASAHAYLAGRKTAPLGIWKPGDTDTASSGIAAYGLDETPPAEPADMQPAADTRLKHVARALALGTVAGATVAAVGSRMRNALTLGLGALAIYEIVTAVSNAAMTLFGRRGVELGQWYVDPRVQNCPICIANANASPRRLGQPWPSGHSNAPVHVGCACTVLPA